MADEYGHARVLSVVISQLRPDQAHHLVDLLEQQVADEGWQPELLSPDQTDFLLP